MTAVPPLTISDLKTSALEASRPHIIKGTVTQTGLITAGVTLNAAAGVITTVSSTLAADASVKFTVTNSFAAADSVILANVVGYTGTATTAVISVNVITKAEGSFEILIGNGSAAALDQVLVIGFLIV